MLVIPAVPYIFTGFAGCSVGPEISCGARKLTRTSRVIKKNELKGNTKTLGNAGDEIGF
jgi:hypothetical protein